MKKLIIICLSLSVLLGRLEQSKRPFDAQAKIPAGLQRYWFKKTRKEVLKYNTDTNTLYKAINNSFHFVGNGIISRMLYF